MVIYMSQRWEKTDYWYQALDHSDGGIYRLIRNSEVQTEPKSFGRDTLHTSDSNTNLALGEQLFKERACNACHAVDGKTELLGPNLRHIGNLYTREELRQEIENPSLRMKPGTFATRIETVHDQTYLGRVISKNEVEIQLMLIGNQIKRIPLDDIKHSEVYPKSMMYEGLLNGLSTDEVDAPIELHHGSIDLFPMI